ncbi:unnamed protein product [Cuscuta europaea]|uniref:FHA domain-containing protein n=1 Tax=Cuscuta europaea TaxID=41803 RepID=A0A9P0Z628_CUSEU|nr:unnamed protein product [Cuscuta europaea]
MEHRESTSEKTGERKIPVFTVLKNNAILKNIFLIDNQPLAEGSYKKSEEILLVGRHPDCNITLEHPSISRFHLRIYSQPSSQSLSVVDLSSVHGTWIGGKKIESGVRINLREGDTMQLGGSSRVYRLHWIPSSQAYDMDNPFLPPILLQSEPSCDKEGEDQVADVGFFHKSEELESLDSEYADSDVPSSISLVDDKKIPAANEEYSVDTDIQSLLKDCFCVGQQLLTPEKENHRTSSCLPLGSLKDLFEFDSRTGPTVKPPLLEVDGIAFPVKERVIMTKSESYPDTDSQFPLEDPFLSGEKTSTPENKNCPSSSPTLRDALKNTDEFDLRNGSQSVLEVHEVDDEIVTPNQEKVVIDIHFPSGDDTDSKMLTPDQFDLGNGSPTSLSLLKVNEVEGEIVTPDQDKVTMDIELLEVLEVDDEIVTPNQEKVSIDIHFPSGDDTDSKILTPDQFDLGNGSPTSLSLLKVNEVDGEIVTPDQEKVTMDIELLEVLEVDDEIVTPNQEKVSIDIHFPSRDDTDSKILTPDQFDLGNGSPTSLSLLKVNEVDGEIVTPDQEKVTMAIELPSEDNLSPYSVPPRSLSNKESGSTIRSSEDDVVYKVVGKGGDIMVVPDIENVSFGIYPPSDGGYVNKKVFNPVKEKENPTLSSVSLQSLKNTDEFDLKTCGSTLIYSLPKVDEIDQETVATPIKESIPLDIPALSGGDMMDVEEILYTSPGKENCTRPTMRLSFPNMEEGGDKQTISPNKENETLNTHLQRLIQPKGKLQNLTKLKVLKPSPLKNENCDDERDDETFTPDKENMTPNTHFMWSMNKIGKSREAINNSELADDFNSRLHQYEQNNNEKELKVKSNVKELGLHMQQSKQKDRVPFRSVLINSRSTTESFCPGMGDKICHFSEPKVREKERSWCIVVDTTSLLNKESRKALHLLQGLKSTSLIIPRIVIKELGCMKSRASFFTRTTEVSSALEWVEDCMKNSKWWVHVQSLDEEEETSDIATPTPAEDRILKYALFLRKINNGLTKLILLSDDISLKIKSMAEGLLCETAKDFRESLVNPFSERFLWTKSSPRGITWSYEDDIVLKETYYQRPLKKPHSKQANYYAWGLKLILLLHHSFPSTQSTSSSNKN